MINTLHWELLSRINVWYYSTVIVSINIFSVERQRGRFAGFLLYLSNSDVSSGPDIKGSNLCYNNILPLPPLNFTTICLKQGRYIIYYNERLEEVTYPTGYELYNVYTELCEVKVQGKYKKNPNPIYQCKCKITELYWWFSMSSKLFRPK